MLYNIEVKYRIYQKMYIFAPKNKYYAISF